MPAAKLNAHDRNQFIAWLAESRKLIEGKRVDEILKLAATDLKGAVPPIKTARRFMTDIGIEFKNAQRHPGTNGHTTMAYVRTLAGIVRNLHRELGQTAPPELLEICEPKD